jgi:hypothetical protein
MNAVISAGTVVVDLALYDRDPIRPRETLPCGTVREGLEARTEYFETAARETNDFVPVPTSPDLIVRVSLEFGWIATIRVA